MRERDDRRPTEVQEQEAARRDPALPAELNLDLKELPRGMKAELRGLPGEIADKVGLRLLAAGQLIDVDPDAAYAQVKVARRLAARLPVVRAAVAEIAYAAGDYHAALTDYRALRRMSGGDEYLPVMADCERALGRPEEALRLAREAGAVQLDPASSVEMAMVEAGARADMGQHAEALRILERKIRETQRTRVNDTSRARLRYAYADQLIALGDVEHAREWFQTAAKLDQEGVTDADERLAELDGVVLELDEEAFFDDDADDNDADDEELSDDPDAEEGISGEQAFSDDEGLPDDAVGDEPQASREEEDFWEEDDFDTPVDESHADDSVETPSPNSEVGQDEKP